MKLDIELPLMTKPRRYPRALAPQSLIVAWQGGGRRGASHVRDLSLGGAYIWNPNPPDPGTPVQLLFDSPEGEMRISAQVRYVKPRIGMGIQFLGMDFPARRRLATMVHRLLA